MITFRNVSFQILKTFQIENTINTTGRKCLYFFIVFIVSLHFSDEVFLFNLLKL